MKELIYRNQQPIDEFESKLNQAATKVDQAYQLYRKAPFAEKSHTLIDVLQNIDAIVQSYKLKMIENMKPGSFALEGIQLSKNKLADLVHVEEPEGLRSAIFKANQELNGINLDHLEIKYNKVIVNKALLEKFIDKHSIYAGTPKQKEFLQKYEDLGKSIEAFSNFLKSECDIQILPKPLAPMHIGLWFDLDEKNHYQVKPRKFEALAKRMRGR
jgi:hypothetical protein